MTEHDLALAQEIFAMKDNVLVEVDSFSSPGEYFGICRRMEKKRVTHKYFSPINW